jgi:hypothetical protein
MIADRNPEGASGDAHKAFRHGFEQPTSLRGRFRSELEKNDDKRMKSAKRQQRHRKERREKVLETEGRPRGVAVPLAVVNRYGTRAH